MRDIQIDLRSARRGEFGVVDHHAIAKTLLHTANELLRYGNLRKEV